MMTEMTRHEYLREIWETHPVVFSVEDYRRGYPVANPEAGTGFSFTPWPKGSDMPDFADKAARAMLDANPMTCPLDIYDFALRLRRIYVLESLGLPTDPKSINLVRHIENLTAEARECGFGIDSEAIQEAVASFVVTMQEKVRLPGSTRASVLDDLKRRVASGNFGILDIEAGYGERR